MCAAAFASMTSMRCGDSLLPALAMEFAIMPGEAAGVISAFALAYGLLQLFYGPMGDRFGKFRVVSLATLACTVGAFAAALSPSFAWLRASRFLSGAAAAGIIPLTMAWIGDNVPYERRQEVLAKLLGATVCGMIAGQWLGGLVADTWGWRTGFALLGLLFAATSWLLVREQRAIGTAPVLGLQRALPRTLAVLALPWARKVLAVTFVEGALAFAAIAFVPSHLHARFGLSMTAAGAILALYGVGGLLYSRCARRLVRQLGEKGLAGLGGACLATAFGLLAWLPKWQWALPACLLGGFGFYALHNTLQTNATQMAPESRGTAVALFASSLFFGQSLGIVGAAEVVNRFSAVPVFAMASLGLLLVGVTFVSLLSFRDRAQQVSKFDLRL
jgi:predicted MFS family arabinose efflux permease